MDDTPKDPKHTAYVRREVEAGLRDSEAGRTVSVEEVRERFGLAAWHEVYEGLSEDEVAEVEAMALDRSRFSREDPK